MKTSTYVTIAISIVLAVSVTIVILFVNDVSIKDSHRNPRIPENIKKGRVVYMHTHDSIKYHKDYYEIENGETYFSVKGDFKNYLLQSELEVFVTGNVDK